MDKKEKRYQVLNHFLSRHGQNAFTKQDFYGEALQAAANASDGTLQHIIFDFAEKLLLPRLARPPGKLNFVTGIYFNQCRVQKSTNENTRFGLRKGYRPNEKTASTVLSMIQFATFLFPHFSHSEQCIQHFKLQADNCARH